MRCAVLRRHAPQIALVLDAFDGGVADQRVAERRGPVAREVLHAATEGQQGGSLGLHRTGVSLGRGTSFTTTLLHAREHAAVLGPVAPLEPMRSLDTRSLKQSQWLTPWSREDRHRLRLEAGENRPKGISRQRRATGGSGYILGEWQEPHDN